MPCYLHTIEHYVAVRKDKTLPFSIAWMELKGTLLSKLRQRRKEQIIDDHIVVYKAIKQGIDSINNNKSLALTTKLRLSRSGK